MIQFAFIFAFVLSLAATAMGILITLQIRKQNFDHPVVSTHILFQQILFYVFAFYAVWGQVLTQIIFSTDLINEEIINRVSIYIALFSIPFLLGAWYFQLLIALQLAEIKKQETKAGLILLIVIVSGISFVGLFFKLNSIEIIFENVFAISNALVYGVVAFGFAICKNWKYSKTSRTLIVTLILLVGSVYVIGAWFHSTHIISTILFIIFIFVGNLWLPVLFKTGFEITCKSEELKNLTFDDFCLKYEISKRESEIAQLVCEGLSNKEIAEKLFITLQTVKDHTSRIYLKTQVKNRTQLSNLVRGNA